MDIKKCSGGYKVTVSDGNSLVYPDTEHG